MATRKRKRRARRGLGGTHAEHAGFAEQWKPLAERHYRDAVADSAEGRCGLAIDSLRLGAIYEGRYIADSNWAKGSVSKLLGGRTAMQAVLKCKTKGR